MKRTAFIIFILFTYYLAAMYRSLPLMVLCVVELLFLLFMFVLPRYFRSRLSAVFSEAGKYTDEGMDALCHISVHNRGRLPVSRFELRLRVRYMQDARFVKTKLYGSAECGANSFEFHLSGQYCGLALVRIDRLRVFDYLVLFRAGKRLSEEMKIAVFPRAQALHIKLSELDWDYNVPIDEWTVNRQGEEHSEIRQIREYRTGDSRRHIHWNQSARTDGVWIKEYESRTASRVDILIDSTDFSHASAIEMGAYYKVLSALVLGLLQEGALVNTYWYHSDKGEFVSMDVTDASQCRGMLLRLYQTDFSHEKMPLQKAEFEYSLRLTLELELFKGDTLIHEFYYDKLDSEIQDVVLTI